MMSTHAPAVDDFVDRVLDVINCEPVETDNFLRSVFSQFGDVEFIVRWSSAGLKHHAFVGFRDPQPVAVVVHKQLPQALSRGWRLSRLNPDLRERVASMVPPGTDTSPGIHPPPPNDSLVSPRLSNQDRIRSHSRSQLPVNGWQPGPHSEGRAAPRSNWDRDPVRRSFPSPGDVPPYGRTMPPPSEYDLYDVGPVMSGPPLDLDPIRGVHHGDHRVRGRFERNRSLSPPPGWGGPATPDWDLARPLSPRLRGRNRSPQRLSSHSIPGPPPRPPFPHDPRDHGLHVAEKGPAPGPFYNPEHDRWPRRPHSPPPPQWIVPGPGAFGIPKRARSMSRERPSHPNRQPRTSDVRMSTEKDRHRKHQREASQTHLKSSNDTAADTSVPRGRSVSPVGQRGVWPPADALGQSVDPRQPLNNKSSVTTVSSPTPLSASAESFSTAPVRDSTSSVSTIPAAVEATPIQLGPAETAVDLIMSPGFELPSHPASLTERMKQEKAPMEAYMGLAQEYAKHDVNLAEWVAMTGIESSAPIKPLLLLMAHLQTTRARRLVPNSAQANACLSKAAEWLSKAHAMEGDHSGTPQGSGEGLEWFRKIAATNQLVADSFTPQSGVITAGGGGDADDAGDQPVATPTADASEGPNNSTPMRNGTAPAAASEQLSVRLAEAQTAHQHVLSQLKTEQTARARLQEHVVHLEQLLKAAEAQLAEKELTREASMPRAETESEALLRAKEEKARLLTIVSEERMAKRKAEDAEQEERTIRRKLEDQLWVLGGTQA